VGVKYANINTMQCNAMQHNTIRFIRFPEKIFIPNLQNNFAVKSYNWFMKILMLITIMDHECLELP